MARFFGKYVLHCNGIDPFVTLMGNFNWGPISCNDNVSNCEAHWAEGMHLLIFFTVPSYPMYTNCKGKLFTGEQSCTLFISYTTVFSLLEAYEILLRYVFALLK